MKLNIRPEWLSKMADKEDNGIISVGGFFYGGTMNGFDIDALYPSPWTVREDGGVGLWSVFDAKDGKVCMCGFRKSIADLIALEHNAGEIMIRRKMTVFYVDGKWNIAHPEFADICIGSADSPAAAVLAAEAWLVANVEKQS